MKQQVKRFSVRFPLDVLEAVKQAAQEDDRPINSEIVWLLRQALASRKGKREKDGKKSL
jgi:hypothetical protein